MLEARINGRFPVATDLNPIAIALTRAKNANVSIQSVFDRLDALEAKFQIPLYLPLAEVESDDIKLIYHQNTLAQLCYLKRRLGQSKTEVDAFIIGALLGVMHGKPRKDGSSAYASISMPNTFSMSPDYVRRFVATNQLERPVRNVFELLRHKVRRLFDAPPLGAPGIVGAADATRLPDFPQLSELKGQAKLIMTSPPYLDVVNYAKQNWIRLWMLGEDVDAVHEALDDTLTPTQSIDFMEDALDSMREFLADDGSVVLVIGDVARSKNSVLSPARDLMRRLFAKRSFEYIGCISDYLEVEGKTTRIWKETKGKATAIDRVVILANSQPNFRPVEMTKKVGQLELSETRYEFDAALMADHAREFAGIG